MIPNEGSTQIVNFMTLCIILMTLINIYSKLIAIYDTIKGLRCSFPLPLLIFFY